MNIRNGAFVLLSNAGATGQQSTLPGGRYVWTVNCPTWNGATATLQVLGADGATLMNVVSATQDGSFDITVGQNATVQVTVSGGPPSGMYSTMRQYA